MEELKKRILSLKTEERRQLAKVVRSERSVWNAVFGIGDAPGDLEDGVIAGLVREGSKLMPEVTVKAFYAKQEKTGVTEETALKEEAAAAGEGDLPPVQQTITDVNGYYELKLKVGLYYLSFERGSLKVVVRDIMIVTGHTDTRNAVFG